mgnify:CR=1 FL=1
MNIQNWNKSAYVTIGQPSFLSSGRLLPSVKEGVPPSAVAFPGVSPGLYHTIFSDFFNIILQITWYNPVCPVSSLPVCSILKDIHFSLPVFNLFSDF